jgi:F-type H+-transporting ATPase subunit b
MEILNLQQIIWQAINFLVLYFVISKYIVPPTKKFMAQREKQIQDGIKNAELVKKQLTEAEKSKEEILSEARSEGKALIEQMRAKSEELSKKMLAEAREEAQTEVRKLIEKHEQDFVRKQTAMNAEVLKLAKVIAEKALSDSLTVDMQHEILKKQLDQVKKSSVQG